MKRFALITGLLALLVVLFFFLGGTYDYGLVCTRCLYHEHRVQPRPFGLPLWDHLSGSPGNPYAKTYQTLFGHPCEHIMKTRGFGYQGGCGVTAEGGVFLLRNQAIAATFEAYQRIPNADLARRTYRLINQLFPDTTTTEDFFAKQRTGQEDNSPVILMQLSLYLDQAQTTSDWEKIYAAALEGFVKPLDLQPKTNQASKFKYRLALFCSLN